MSDKDKYDKKVTDKIVLQLKKLYLENLIRNGTIKKVRHNKQMVFFEVKDINKGFVHSDDATLWYRTMSKEDFYYLQLKGELVKSPSFSGIAPNFDYVAQTKYFGNNTDGAFIVEFKLNCTGKEFVKQLDEEQLKLVGKKDFKKEGPKGEGGGTIGLGETGMYKGTAGELFNQNLQMGIFSWRLISFRWENPLPKDELYY